MGIRDYDDIFDSLDSSYRGFLTASELQDFHKSMYFSSIPLAEIKEAISDICGDSSGGKVTRELFIVVLLEIERLRSLQELAFFDFQALDRNGDNRITLHDALLLFKESHGENFSLKTWHDFLRARETVSGDVSYDEIKAWLCKVPDGEPCSQDEFLLEERHVEKLMADLHWQEYKSWENFQEADEYENGEYRENLNREAKRKLNKWNRQGVEAVIYDDGLDLGLDPDNQPLKARNHVNISDVLEAVDKKYNILQDRLLLKMAEESSNLEREVTETFQTLRKQTQHMLKDGDLSEKKKNLQGANVQLPFSLLSLLGHHKADEDFSQTEGVADGMKKDGKSGEEIREMAEKLFDELNQGSKNCGDILTQLEDRRQQERDYCLSVLHGGSDHKTTTNILDTELASLTHQHGLLGYESTIDQSAFSLGLGERTSNKDNTLEGLDCIRFLKLAELRLKEKKGRKQGRVTDGKVTPVKTDNLGLLDLRLKIVEEIDRKHYFEREAAINMLQGPDSKTVIEDMRKLSEKQRQSEVTHLRNQHMGWMNGINSTLPDSSTLDIHHNLLHKGVAIYWLKHQSDMEVKQPNISDDEVSATVLSEIQNYQESEIKDTIEHIKSLTKEELKKVLKKQHVLCINECFEGIAFVTLGSLQISDDDKEFITALDEKYSALRDKIFLFILQQQYGLDWINLPVDVKQKEIVRLRKEEKKIRSSGKHGDYVGFLGKKAMALPSLRSLLGPCKWWKLDSTTGQGEEFDVLTDMIGRYDEEQQALLNWLQSPDAKTLSIRKRRKEVLYTRLQTRTIGQESDLQAAYLSTGLLERLDNREAEDKTRTTRLCELNVKVWKERKEQGKKYRKFYPDLYSTSQGDILTSQLQYLMEIKHRHGDEKEQLLQIVKEVSSEDLQEAAAMMGEGDRQKRLAELQTKYQKLDLSVKDDVEEFRSVLEEAGAIQVICRKARLQKELERGVTVDMTAVSLLENLYRQHDKELMSLFADIDKMEEEELVEALKKERERREKDILLNVIKVLTMVEGAAHEHDILQIIEKKYDVLKERLLLESLTQTTPPDMWNKMTNVDKQKQVVKLKEKTEIAWRQGNVEEFVSVLNDNFKLNFDLSYVVGTDREMFNKDGDKAILEVGKERSVEGAEVVRFLWNRLEAEKKYIINLTRGTSQNFMSDNEKFALVSRLTREMTLCGYENSLYLSALLVGLLERQVKDTENIPQKDVPRFNILADETLTWCRQQKEDIKITNGDKSTERIPLQNHVLSKLHNQQLQERLDWFRLLNSDRQTDIRDMASVKSKQQRNDRLIALKKQRSELKQVDTKENMNILLEAMVYGRENLTSNSNDEEFSEEKIQETMMSLLLQQQHVQAEQILLDFKDKSTEELTWLGDQLTSDQHNKRCNNIAAVVFSTNAIRETTQDELVTALEGKYDALRDKLIVEALINQYGELDWAKITDSERQKKIMELKLKERRLRREGKVDEVNKLIGQSLKNQEALTKLLGDSQVEQERRLKERLERRQKRLKEGKTEKECNELEKEEILQEEEEEKKRKKNVLLELEHQFDQEKEALMKQLMTSGDSEERERQKQAQLIKLRQEERKARKEDGFASAALVLGLAQMNNEKVQQNLEEEKERQWRLAKERLMAARKRKMAGKKKLEDTVMEDIENLTDKTRLREILLMMADHNHSNNRDLLIQLLEDVDDDAIAVLKPLTNDNIETKISEACELRSNWKESTNQNPEDQISIFKEVSPCTVECKGREKGHYYDLDEVKVELLADIQHLQDIDSRKLRLQIPQKDIQWLKNKITETKNDCNHEDIAMILFLGQGQPEPATNQEETAVIAALEKKYDLMKDKLIVEALMKEMGQADWNRLSQLERQKKVIHIKLRNRKLKKEGKMDAEVSALIGKHLQDAKAVNTLLGESKIDQQRRFEEKLAKRRLLRVEREATSLEREDSTLEEQQKMEEKKILKKNILENLEKQLEEDKERLLKSLRNKTTKAEKAKARWKALAKLQHESKLLKQEDDIDSACLVFKLGNETSLRKEKSFISERQRQRDLAKDRLKHKLQQGKKVVEDSRADVMQHLENSLTAVTSARHTDIKDVLVENLDKHHFYERDVLMQLLKAADDNKELIDKVADLKEDEIRKSLDKLQQDLIKIQTDCQHIALSVNLQKMDQSDQQTYLVGVAKRRVNQFQLLMEATVYRTEVELKMMQESRPDATTDSLRKELSVSLLADLQERQETESKMLRNLIVEKENDILENIGDVQKVCEREGWYKNLSMVLFTLTSSSDDLDLLPDITMETQKLEEEFEKQIEIIKEKAVSLKEDPTPQLQELQESYNHKKQEMMESYESKRRDIRKRLEKKIRDREATKIREKDASSLLQMAETHAKAKVNGWAVIRKKSSLLQERLMAKREEKQKEEHRRRDSVTSSRSKSVESAKRALPMERERTAVDVEVSQDEKQAMFSQLVRQQKNLHSKMSEQQKNQEEMLQRRLNARRHGQTEQAAALITMGERQKTIIEQQNKEEKERQKMMVKERLERAKTKRGDKPAVRSKSVDSRHPDNVEEEEKGMDEVDQ